MEWGYGKIHGQSWEEWKKLSMNVDNVAYMELDWNGV